jgi:hypothetical protein
MEAALEPSRFTGRAAAQTREFLVEVVSPRLALASASAIEGPRV